MRRGAAIVATVVLAISSPASSVQAASVPARYIVVYRDAIDVDRKTDQLDNVYGLVDDFRYRHALHGFAARLSVDQLAHLRADPDVAFVSLDRTLSTSDQVPLQPGDSAPTGVRRIGAATTTTASRASDVNVAVLDSGIDLRNSDLNAVNGTNCIRSNRTAQDDNGHGTHVAGTIAAKNNGAGVVGVAPGTRLYAVKVVDSQGSGTDAQVICGIDWVTGHAASLNIKVANMSLGGPGADDANCGKMNNDALHAAICRSVAAGVTYVVAAGNSSEDFASTVPASYDEVLTVTAMADYDGLPGGRGSANCLDGFLDADDSASYFSNFASGPDAGHTIAAPGVCITSTWPGGSYQTISGTSMASPHVAGAVALCFGSGGVPGRCAGMTPAQAIARVRGDAAGHAGEDPTNGFDGDPAHSAGVYYGYLAWTGAARTTPPVITNVRASSVSDVAAIVEWNTDEAADSQVEYGPTAAYGSSTPLDPTFVLGHVVTLSGLRQTTTYHYRVKSRDGWGTLAVGNDLTFTTKATLPDLVLSGSAAPEPVTSGDPLTYTLALQNRGPAAASTATVTLALPPPASFVSASTSQGSCSPSGANVVCALGGLGVGAAGQVLADHPLAYWRLGDAVGSGTAADASGNGNAGSYESGITLGQPGAVSGDTAATFNGVAAVDVPDVAALNLSTALSIEAWVRPSVAGESGGIFEKTIGGAVNTQYSLLIEHGVVMFRAKPAASAYLNVVGPTLATNTWSHLVGTFDGSNLRLYVNGVLAGTVATSALAGGAGVSLIGRLGSGFYPFQGSLDEVAVFASALSADRVLAHYQGGVSLRVVVSTSGAGTLTTTITASSPEVDGDPSNNSVTLSSTVQ